MAGQRTQSPVPRDHWLEKWEKEAIVKFFAEYPLEGYRRPCFMMLDRDIVAVSPASVYRVLKAEGLLANRWSKPSRIGTGCVQPLAPHDHWHIDFSYVNVGGTFYDLCSILDGCSRSITIVRTAKSSPAVSHARGLVSAAEPGTRA